MEPRYHDETKMEFVAKSQRAYAEDGHLVDTKLPLSMEINLANKDEGWEKIFECEIQQGRLEYWGNTSAAIWVVISRLSLDYSLDSFKDFEEAVLVRSEAALIASLSLHVVTDNHSQLPEKYQSAVLAIQRLRHFWNARMNKLEDQLAEQTSLLVKGVSLAAKLASAGDALLREAVAEAKAGAGGEESDDSVLHRLATRMAGGHKEQPEAQEPAEAGA